MHCDFRALRVNAEIVYWHAQRLRCGPGTGPFRSSAFPRAAEQDALARLRRAFDGDPLPDLERAIAARSNRPSTRVRQVLARCGDALEAVARTRLVVMDTCGVDARGRVVVGTSLACTGRAVRAGDELLSGAYLYADLAQDTVSIGPRFLRPARWTAFALPGRRIGAADDVGRILRGSAARRLAGVVDALRGVTWVPVTNALAALATLGIHVPADRHRAYVRAFEAGREHTLFGALAALADLARVEPRLDGRMRLERLAGEALLACAPLAAR